MTQPSPIAYDSVVSIALALLAGALGPLLGQIVLILGFSFVGALIALSRAKTEKLLPHGLIVLGRGMAVAGVAGAIGSVLWARWLGDGWGYPESLAAVSFIVGLRTEWALAKFIALTGGEA